MVDANTANILIAATQALPAILSGIKALHATANPGAEPLTDAQALAALQQAVRESLAKDDVLVSRIASSADLGIVTGSTGD